MLKTPSLPGHIRDFVEEFFLCDGQIQNYLKDNDIIVTPLRINKEPACISRVIGRDNGKYKLLNPTILVGFEPYIVGSHLDAERNGFSIESARCSAGGIPLGFGFDCIDGISNKNLFLDRNFLITTCDVQKECHHIPFISMHPRLLGDNKIKRIHRNNNRPFSVGYMNRTKCPRRESMFDCLVEKIGENKCHALGERCGSYPSTLKPSSNPRSGNDCWYNDELYKTYSQYDFVLAMENTISKGYVTEKILNAFLAGAIPIYYGDSLVKEIFNPDSFINITDFNSIEDCAEYISLLSNQEIEKMRSLNFFKTPLHDFFNKDSQVYSLIRRDILKLIR